MRTLRVIVTVGMVVTVWSLTAVSVSSHPPAHAPEQAIVADLEGRPIGPAEISAFHCHDFDYPRIHCYRTAAKLAAGERRWGALDGKLTAQSAAFGANDYVSIFDGNAYTGAGMDLSQNYDTLFGIGWNDRISSYKGRNSKSGKFWTDWFATGTGVSFCCNMQVSSLPAGQDNAFTSVYRS